MLRETTSRGLSGLVCPSRTSKHVARENPRRPWAGTLSVTLLLSAAADLSRRPVRPRAVQGGIFGAGSAYLVPALPGHGPVEPHHALRSSAQDIGRHAQVSRARPLHICCGYLLGSAAFHPASPVASSAPCSRFVTICNRWRTPWWSVFVQAHAPQTFVPAAPPRYEQDVAGALRL